MSVRAQSIRLDTGQMEHEFVEAGPLDDLFAIFERVGRRLAGPAATGRAARAARAAGVRELHQGLVATATPAKIGYLEAAIKLDPGFDRARLALWNVHHDEGNGQVALVTAAAVPETSPMYARARFSAALSLLQLKRLDDAFATFRTLADRAPTATLMNNIGVIQLRRPVTPQTGRATYYFNQALKLDEDDPDYYFNLGYAYWAEKDAQAAIFWLREAVRRNPADGEAHAVLAAALQATGAAAEAARERELATQLSSTYAEWAKKPAGPAPRRFRAAWSGSSHRLEVSTLRRVDSAIATTGQREQKELAAFHLDRGPQVLRAGEQHRGDHRACPRDLSVAVRGGGASAAGPHLSENRGNSIGHQCLQDRAVEPGNGRGAGCAGAGVHPSEGSRWRAGGAGARAGHRSEFLRRQRVTR